MNNTEYITSNLMTIINDQSTNVTTQDKLRALDMLMTMEKRREDALAHALGRNPNPFQMPYNQIYY